MTPRPFGMMRRVWAMLVLVEAVAMGVMVCIAFFSWLPFENIDPGEGAVPVSQRNTPPWIWLAGLWSGVLLPWFALATTHHFANWPRLRRTANGVVALANVVALAVAIALLA